MVVYNWWLLGVSLACVFSQTWGGNGRTVAVCIGGQVPRLQPSLFQPLFDANPEYTFKLFYSLQYSENSKDTRFWSDATMVYEPTLFTNISHLNMKTALQSVYANNPNVEVISTRFSKGLSARNWSLSLLNGAPLSVITLPSEVPEIVFNMYAKQSDCLRELTAYEQSTKTLFDWVFWGREDLHFYQELNLQHLTQLFSPHLVTRPDNSSHTVTCQLLTRSCLQHGGISMRGYLWKRNTAVQIMANRFNYYNSLQQRNISVITVEAFEKSIMEHYNVTVCTAPVDDFPTVAVRHVSNGSFCIPPMEVRKACYPAGKLEYVREHLCHSNASESLVGKSVSARIHAKVEAELATVRKKLKDSQERNYLLERKIRTLMREKEAQSNALSALRSAVGRPSKGYVKEDIVALRNSLSLAEARIAELQIEVLQQQQLAPQAVVTPVHDEDN